MFDIFTSNADGSLQLIESVGCSDKAQDLAHRLSCLFPGAYFGWFERAEGACEPFSGLEGGRADAPRPVVSSEFFLA